MIEIVKDQVVYNAGSHLDIDCVFRNTTGKRKLGGTKADSEASRSPAFNFMTPVEVEEPVAPGTIAWLHNGEKFSHRNRRR